MPKPLPSAHILLGTADGESYGYKRPVSIYVTVKLGRQSDYGNPPREQQTTDHRTVIDPIELSVTFDVIAPNGRDIGGGAMGQGGLDAVTTRAVDNETWARVGELVPWHLNALQAACDHQTVEYESSEYGPRPSLMDTLPCPATGYRYGHAWLVRELPISLIQHVEALAKDTVPTPMPLAAFIAEHGISANVRHSTEPRRKGWPEDANHWTVTLRRRMSDHPGGALMVVPFSQGSAHTEPPTLSEVLECVVDDCATFENARDLQDWIAEYGTDPHDLAALKEAERKFRAVGEQAAKLRAFLGDDAYNALVSGEV